MFKERLICKGDPKTMLLYEVTRYVEQGRTIKQEHADEKADLRKMPVPPEVRELMEKLLETQAQR